MRIHQVKGRLVNSYIIEQENVIEQEGIEQDATRQKSALCVVDVAWRGEKYVLGHVREVLGRDPADIRLVVCTHGDPDHSGGVNALARICGAQTGFPKATHSLRRHLVGDPAGLVIKPITALLEGLRPRAWAMYASPSRGARARSLPMWLPDPTATPDSAPEPGSNGRRKPDHRLKHHRELPGFPGWQVIHTPGHSWDSVCYFHAASGSLISGDTLLGSGSKGRLVAPSVYANPLQMARTLRRLKTLHPTAVYPGHGSQFEGKGLLDHL